MKVSLNWVKDYVGVDLEVDELVRKIGAQLGAVEEVIDLSKKYEGIIIAKVVSCEKHPNADKLSVCLIDDGGRAKNVERSKEGLVQVVCGAPNVRAGLLAAWLPPGSTVPSSLDKEPFVLEAREIRGVVSNGMLASASELALYDDHSGIVELSSDGAEPGADFADTYKLNDHIIDIENKMFTHRPDCFGQLGVAREIAGINGQKFDSPDWYVSISDIKPASEELKFEIKNEIKDLVPRFAAVVMSGVKVGPSPFWLQSRLARLGIRPINNIVDLTNYYMVLTGQPLHAYDYDKLPAKSLETRLAKQGEKLTLLSGKVVEFKGDDAILITSGDKPVGIGGVMGGQDTEVDDSTKNIVLECANFDMYSIRRTSMAYGLFTDAVTRFSKGQSPHQNDKVLAKIIEDIRELAGGSLASPLIDDKSDLMLPIAVNVRADFINSRLGSEIDIQDMARLLTNVEFDVKVNGPTLTVTPPFWRTDIEIAEDVVEEIGRLHGFDNLPIELPGRTIKPAQEDGMLKLKSSIRQILGTAGANEVLTYSFVHGDLLEKAGQDNQKAFELSNAISPDLQYYRLSLTPSLLDKVHPNIKAGFTRFCLFEIGKSHSKEHVSDDDNLPSELEKLALVFASADKDDIKNGAAYYYARRYLDELAQRLGLSLVYKPLNDKPDYQTAQPFDPDRTAEVIEESTNQTIGIVGEYSQSVVRKLKLPKLAAGFELSTMKLLSASRGLEYQPLSRYPKVTQDISMKVPADMQYVTLYDFVSSNIEAPADVMLSLEPLDIYQKDDDKHITLRLSAVSHERTLTDQEINKVLDDVAEKAHDKLNVRRI